VLNTLCVSSGRRIAPTDSWRHERACTIVPRSGRRRSTR
jgi:hypothetical protein